MNKHFFKAVLAVAAVSSALLNAAEYSVQSQVSMVADHDDNIRLSASDEDAVAGARVTPSAMLAYKTETLEASLDVEAEFSRFNDSNYDSDDQDVGFALSQKGELLIWGLTADVVRDSTRTSDPLRVIDIERREQYSIAPYAEYWLGENVRLNGSLSYSETDYENKVNYTSYSYAQGSIGLIYLLGKNGHVGFTAAASSYEGDPLVSIAGSPLSFFIAESSSDSEALDYRLTAKYRFTEKISLSGQLGYSDRDNTYSECAQQFVFGFPGPRNCVSLETESSSESVDIVLDYSGEQHAFEASLGVSDSPSSEGVIVKNSTLSVVWNWQVSENGQLKNSLQYGERETSDDSLDSLSVSNDVQRDYGNYKLRYSHRLTEEWFSHIEYRYRYNERSTLDDTAESNVIALGFTYRPTKTTWSR
jgi:hypothetical protein